MTTATTTTTTITDTATVTATAATTATTATTTVLLLLLLLLLPLYYRCCSFFIYNNSHNLCALRASPGRLRKIMESPNRQCLVHPLATSPMAGENYRQRLVAKSLCLLLLGSTNDQTPHLHAFTSSTSRIIIFRQAVEH